MAPAVLLGECRQYLTHNKVIRNETLILLRSFFQGSSSNPCRTPSPPLQLIALIGKRDRTISLLVK
jgi:hypothetical protein